MRFEIVDDDDDEEEDGIAATHELIECMLLSFGNPTAAAAVAGRPLPFTFPLPSRQ